MEFDKYRDGKALPYRVVLLDRAECPAYPPTPGNDPNGWDKPLFCVFGEDPQPYTWRRLVNTYAWIRLGSAPIAISIDRDGGLLGINTLSNALNMLGTPKELSDKVYTAMDAKEVSRANVLIADALDQHNENVRKQLAYDKAMKELELAARLIQAMPELKQNPGIQKLLNSGTKDLLQIEEK